MSTAAPTPPPAPAPVDTSARPAEPAPLRQAREALAAPIGHPRFEHLDGIRALAALAVVVTHVSFASGASESAWWGTYTSRLDAGVAVFFVIAGFLLYRPYVARRIDGVRAPDLAIYAERRALRVLPAYWAALALLAIAGLISFDSRWWEHVLLVQIYDHQQVLGGLTPAWSLAVEISFYAVLPLIVALMARVGRRGARIARLFDEAVLVTVLLVGSIAFRAVLDATTDGTSVWFTTLPGDLDWFAIGMGLAVASVWLQRPRKRKPVVIDLIERYPGGVWILAAALFWVAATQLGERGTWGVPTSDSGRLVEHVLYGVIGGLIVAPAVFAGSGQGAVREVLRHPFVAWLGLISYGIFLYNAPFAVWINDSGLVGEQGGSTMLGLLLATTVLSVGAGAASFHLLEQPLLRWRRDRIAQRKAGVGSPPAGEAAEVAGAGS